MWSIFGDEKKNDTTSLLCIHCMHFVHTAKTKDCFYERRLEPNNDMFLFQSPNSPTIPQEKIHRITTLYPEDPRAPFYDPSGKPMLPLARLYLSRDSVIPKSCDEVSLDRILEEAVQVAENTEDTTRRELC
jgi:hypothetical protein